MATQWVLTKGLTHFRDSVNRRWPNRDKASDGTIGDLTHQQESSSGHNPDITGNAEHKDGDTLNEVRAFDMDTDLQEPGCTMQDLVDHLVRLPDIEKVFRYLIFNKKIYRASSGWKAEAYTGPSAHTEHLHVSGAYSQSADNNTTFDFRLGEVGEFPVDQATFNKFMTTWAKSTDGKTALATAVLDQSVGYKDRPSRSLRQFVKDLWALRDHEVGDTGGASANPLSPSSPMGTLLQTPTKLSVIDSQVKSNGGGISELKTAVAEVKAEVTTPPAQ
jgi:hypothetical protein